MSLLAAAAVPFLGLTIGLTMSAAAVPHKLRELRNPACPYEALIYSPPGNGPFPLLLYLHGAGEQFGPLSSILSPGATGTPPVALVKGTALEVLEQQFVVVAPHTSNGWNLEPMLRFTDCLLASDSGLSIDPNRLYVTGHSMGGYGALLAATSHRFAAVVPVAPAGAPSTEALAGVPVWAFHGRNDVIVPSDVSSSLVAELQSMGADEHMARITLYDDAPAPVGWEDYIGHASTIPAYATPELYQWLLDSPKQAQGHSSKAHISLAAAKSDACEAGATCDT